MSFNSLNSNPNAPRKFSVGGICIIILGMFLFVFGGLTPIFTGNIFHMFIFIGIGFLLFIGGGILTVLRARQNVKMLTDQYGVAESPSAFSPPSQYSNENSTLNPNAYRSEKEGYSSNYSTNRINKSYEKEYSSQNYSGSSTSDFIFCRYCGAKNPEGNKYCGTCGSQIR